MKSGLNSVTVKEALKRASFCLQETGVDQPREEAEILFARIMQIDRLNLFLKQACEVPSDKLETFWQLIERRAKGEPVAYLIQEKYFYGFRFTVNRKVMIPRPETELLVDRAVMWADRLKDLRGKRIKAVDLGTGSGALAVTLALLCPRAEVWAVDSSPAALEVARENASLHNVAQRIRFYQGNYFHALKLLPEKPKFNLIVSNPPYVSEPEINNLSREVKDYEPRGALYGGKDGLDHYRQIFEQLPDYTAEKFLLLMEIGAGQKEKVEALLKETGVIDSFAWFDDLSGWPRVLEAAAINH